ncbi:hypothetical protein CPLU01_11980 [Colletotrichum plurivorum]|uniref:Glycosyl transferase CAP10 domain-containing protein n=1 Tax=Colletotrichum plurivorum TaxID=2175906 RepID=A0A8H6N6S9_9PEZI|nr:hypothetical protein CPLU01_11980 [Colletotrichum plurivorum]
MLRLPTVGDLSSHVTIQAALAFGFAVLAQYESSNEIELGSELLCWVLLPVLVRREKGKTAHIDTDGTSKAVLPAHMGSRKNGASSTSLWLVALGLMLASVYRAEGRTAIAFLPGLLPMLHSAQERLLRPDFDSARPPQSMLRAATNTVWGTTLVAAWAILTLTNWDIRPYVLSCVPAGALCVVYGAFLNGASPRRVRLFPSVNFEASLVALASRLVILLTLALVIDAVVFGFPTISVQSALLLGFFKAFAWYYTNQLARHSSWCIAPAVGVFSTMFVSDPFAQPSDFLALSHISGAFFSFLHVFSAISRRGSPSPFLWALPGVLFLPYLANIWSITASGSSAKSFTGSLPLHPVEALSRAAEDGFQNLLARQSSNYTAAHAEYRRRYGMDPPSGFAAWFDFATSHGSLIIDDFDSIYESVSPFWAMSGKEVAQVMDDVHQAPGNELWLCSFSGTRAETRCRHPTRSFDRHLQFSFNKLLGGLGAGTLPDMKFLVNHLDEPRVLIPPLVARGGGSGHAFGNGRFRLTDLSGAAAGREIGKYCPPTTHEQTGGNAKNSTVETYGLPLVTEPHVDNDLCRHPENNVLHGLMARPKSFRLIEGLVPALSTGSPSTMGDILFPSPAYMEDEFQYDETEDLGWSQKHNNVYWAGSTTGGYASDSLWKSYHRQRLVSLAQNIDEDGADYVYLRQTAGKVEGVQRSFVNSRLFDVAFTRIFQCARTQCRDQLSYFRLKYWANKNEVFRSRLAFDLDGNGISGRYYKILASRSTPLKQTILREWHDDRLVPWVHYVPVSLGLRELPELVNYLTSSEPGQARAKLIADQGREWFGRAFREVDLTIYLYRLLLELARLQDPARQPT